MVSAPLTSFSEQQVVPCTVHDVPSRRKGTHFNFLDSWKGILSALGLWPLAGASRFTACKSVLADELIQSKCVPMF